MSEVGYSNENGVEMNTVSKIKNNCMFKHKGIMYYRVISVLTKKDALDEIKFLKKESKKKGLGSFRYKLVEKPLGSVNPIVAYHVYTNKIDFVNLS